MEGKRQTRMGRTGWTGLLFSFALCLMFASPAHAQTTQNSCLDCHSRLDPPLQVKAEVFARSIHAQKGLSCVSCHGGDPTTDDMARAMSPAAGFKGPISRKQIPALCASCHSNAAYMRGFDPSLRTDEFSQYQTSVHGQLLAKGDTKVAVCTDCHGLHDIRAPSDPQSSVYPLNVAKTCATCHANAAYMKPYKIPTDQYASYTASVHYEDLTVKGDLSAPTCVTCHGSHGAAPPGVTSVVNVCSTCHIFQAELFDKSPHKQAFASMGLPGCVVCHSNHRIVEPTDAFIGTGKGAVCVNCHTRGDPGYIAAARIHQGLTELTVSIQRSDNILSEAESSGVEVGSALLELNDARDDLMKARVSVHNFSVAPVEKNIQAGLAVTQKTYKAGVAALAERDYRRKGLGIALIVILAVVIGFGLLIKKVESRNRQETQK
ncbi:MAG TPA: cytochrome c3 family protein [Candidatus Dormibacteraeota bacterium]|nr:cytochrome c3 family protein [Candidatus Dormibacteraeota bacterium]